MKKIILLMLLFCSTSCAAYAQDGFLYPWTATCAMDTNNNLHVMWYMYGDGYANYKVDTYGPTGAYLVSGTPFGPFPGWNTPMLADGPGNNMYLGWYAPGNNQYGQWLLNGSGTEQSQSIFQIATPLPSSNGQPPIGAAIGPGHFYGYQVDVNGNGLFGLDWETTIYNQITGNVYSSVTNAQNYSYMAYGQDSIALGYSTSTGPRDPDGTPLNLNINSSNATSGVYMGTSVDFLSTGPFYNSFGQLWSPVALTTTPNKHQQVIWQSYTGSAWELGIWDINPNGSMYGSPNIQLGAYTFMAAAANSYGGDGKVRVLASGPNANEVEMLTVNPANWATTTVSLPNF